MDKHTEYLESKMKWDRTILKIRTNINILKLLAEKNKGRIVVLDHVRELK